VRRALLTGLALAALAALAGCGSSAPRSPAGASAARGRELIEYYGCGACHVIGGIATARGHVGPPLTGFARKRQIAGALPNTPAGVVRWILSPQRIHPNADMPDLGLGRRGASDIAAYLYGQ
jgi:cytochrome c